MAVIVVPFAAVEARDAGWLGDVLTDLLERGYFDTAPALAERARRLVAECQFVVSGGQRDVESLLTYGQAANVLNVSVSTLRRMVSDGRVPVVRIGAAVRLRRSDLLESLVS
jgi:excisionase family DNA binding protein